MRVITTAAECAEFYGGVLVPTMGALHQGHLALIHRARLEQQAAGRPDPVVVSIFVNPTQFNDRADLERYPRTLERDVQACEAAGADAVFAPSEQVVYPPGQTIATPRLPDVATRPGLEDAHRPGHFAGVCQVVKGLFELTRPRAAVFGEKDWQQLRVIDAMTTQEGMRIRIVGEPTIREPDGLAMSSRNVFLSREDRARALGLWRALGRATHCATPKDAEQTMLEVLNQSTAKVEYAVVRDAENLLPPIGIESGGGGFRALIAARVGSVRLIDNAPWSAGGGAA